ncbi:hypothetical protein CONPUDRAFT_154681 [Coniophora puteana RWD-64-598 SS2]|uniref:Uncharacterized protein n=1 Tax=Coniophora puteana (strain RWD-64-598) TaxID=741705 RepID=A0A5M3MNQ2_CONPW|nr:uncharacterized protein CONPUDRAFT_154681 [Coniophora puteana RWD-64-598 SS2]EIW80667.1 hypothetical protein CONPUDRAFT_154681 [Coniophora puteana RWD-64-598 SS2]
MDRDSEPAPLWVVIALWDVVLLLCRRVRLTHHIEPNNDGNTGSTVNSEADDTPTAEEVAQLRRSVAVLCADLAKTREELRDEREKSACAEERCMSLEQSVYTFKEQLQACAQRMNQQDTEYQWLMDHSMAYIDDLEARLRDQSAFIGA